MDIVVIILVVAAVLVMIFKKFPSFVYYVAFVDIFLRILDFIANNVPVNFISNFINNYFPNSLSNVIELYSSGIFTTVLLWLLLIVYVIFDFYLIRLLWHKK